MNYRSRAYRHGGSNAPVGPDGLSDRQMVDWAERNRIKDFSGVFCRDNLPRLTAKQTAVVNIQDCGHSEKKNGTHWVLVARASNGNFWYMDPLGLSKYPPEEIKKQAEAAGKPIKVMNPDQLQGINSTMCGVICCYYLYQMSEGRDMTDVDEDFNTEMHGVDSNDSWLKRWWMTSE